jgi:predicted nucleic-acid-binding protein
MIGIDTNVLIRIFTRDDPDQLAAAHRLFRSLTPRQPAWISIANLMEIEWVLRSRYGYDRSDVARIIEDLTALPSIVIEQHDTAAYALTLYRTSKADFGECMIAASARSAGCTKVVTFDKTAARDLGMELLFS